ncbi:hypothetical protein LO771_10475 [Streptacidiphilus sp. ASG 303]|uniref:hypothetical protein n=1 Tax=Streptacidiphilus sp. ASG 303 TaxID=2896847 RepID=UPI001E4726D1|nr:hypothetical protein [Streptacidiphilus sp. ASG 303]MCD0482812.1 hypothetical protein [Streptacidiphilus sp. ASG 303]
MRITRPAAVVLACSAAIAGLSACGSDGGSSSSTAAAPSGGAGAAASPSPSPATSGIEALPAAQIAEKAKQALMSAPSLTMTLDIKVDGKTTGGKVSLDRQGHCAGNMTVPGMGSFEVLKSGASMWIKPDAAFLKVFGGGGEAAKLMAGKYLKADGQMKDMGSFCDLKQFADEIAKEKDTGTKYTKEGTVTEGGVTMVVVGAVDPKDGKSLLYVPVTGTPYPVKISHPSGKETGRVTFGGFGEPVVVQTPPADQVIDPSKLGR